MRISSVMVLLLILTLPTAARAADIGYSGFELRGGMVFSSNWDEGQSAGIGVNLGELADGLFIYPALFYSRAETSESLAGTSLDFEITDLALGAEVRYFLAEEMRGFYFGGGPYLNLLTIESAVGVPPFGRLAVVEEEVNNIGAMGVAGYAFGAGRSLRGFVEARYNAVTDFNGAQVLVGLTFGSSQN